MKNYLLFLTANNGTVYFKQRKGFVNFDNLVAELYKNRTEWKSCDVKIANPEHGEIELELEIEGTLTWQAIDKINKKSK